MDRRQAVLGIATATARTGIALVDGDDTLARADFHRQVSPSRALMPALKTVLEAAGLQPADLHALAVTVGPGGFTGIRVGLATARALAEAAQRPLAGVSTLAAVAHAVDGPEPALPRVCWLDAGRHEVYGCLFSSAGDSGEERVGAPTDLLADLPDSALLFVGDGAIRYRDLIAARPGGQPGDRILPLPLNIAAATARLGRAALAGGTALPPAPRYLRPPDATRARA